MALNTIMPIVESFTGFQSLEEVWIGGTYPTSFYSHLPNEVEDTFGKITEQTELGFKNLQNTLTDLKVKVQKPKFSDRIDDYMDEFDNLIKPPVAPRDWAITIGNQMWLTPQGYKREPYADTIAEYKSKGEHVEILDRSKDARAWVGFPGVVRVGKRIIIDTMHNNEANKIAEVVKLLEKDYEVMVTTEGGHLDSVFCPMTNGNIFSSHYGDKEFYNNTLPGWQVFWIETEKNNSANGKWWTQENNFYSPIFNKHVTEKAKDWVGNSQETVFEANMLVVDEHNVICIAEHEQSFKQMEQMGIKPHVVEFPTRHFWDGGIHCITVDVRRAGGCIDYFNG